VLLSMMLAAPVRAGGVGEPHDPGRRALLLSPLRHVRGVGSVMDGVIAEGAARSRTFADLLARLNRSDVFVYVEASRDLPSALSARLLFLAPLAPAYRYVRVQIRAGRPIDEAVALVAHELRHALELAEASDVRDQAALIRLYERIGESGRGLHRYDTAAARDTGRRVREELVGS
jgi:hypothetical protein